MAASAEYELEKRVERLELFPVELEKGMEWGSGSGGGDTRKAEGLVLGVLVPVLGEDRDGFKPSLCCPCFESVQCHMHPRG